MDGDSVERKILIRSKKTRAQKQLNDQERVSNLKNAFSVRKGSIPPKTIILVDDIYTTGSTIDEAAGYCWKMVHRLYIFYAFVLEVEVNWCYTIVYMRWRQ